MGRRALRTGDMITTQPSDAPHPSLWDMSVIPWQYVGRFTFGLYIGGELRVQDAGRKTRPFACVLDSSTMKFGWIQRKYLKRVE